ncbi:uncharacterized protein BDR25DRAFT_362890 [Lindgomyces ingoldianus]|uniref:Uncharacterized protein n=1 Tax=Lindgomyces ingoldianus TaxID=673940 RepID=A0ACB6Q9Y5_9PLEO|nr:uncharacterized protein BDR25DRAFT_362890 [Lindgomyces ingoldianus]KAF2463345.1 hypothetical protein BDR25DRAFT_362890 [Lindgomyces ingoldianus]
MDGAGAAGREEKEGTTEKVIDKTTADSANVSVDFATRIPDEGRDIGSGKSLLKSPASEGGRAVEKRRTYLYAVECWDSDIKGSTGIETASCQTIGGAVCLGISVRRVGAATKREPTTAQQRAGALDDWRRSDGYRSSATTVELSSPARKNWDQWPQSIQQPDDTHPPDLSPRINSEGCGWQFIWLSGCLLDTAPRSPPELVAWATLGLTPTIQQAGRDLNTEQRREAKTSGSVTSGPPPFHFPLHLPALPAPPPVHWHPSRKGLSRRLLSCSSILSFPRHLAPEPSRQLEPPSPPDTAVSNSEIWSLTVIELRFNSPSLF